MPVKNMDLYKNAHLIVSAIRILEHQTGKSPSIESVCHTLSFFIEQGNLIIRKLCEMNVLEMMEGAFGTRLFITDHMAIENIPKGRQVDRLQQELKKFHVMKILAPVLFAAKSATYGFMNSYILR